MATEQARANLREQLDIHQRRLAVLDRQLGYFGEKADPAIEMEADEIRAKVAEIQEKLEPPRGIPVDIWHSMSPDDQRRYLIKLVMLLQADFVGCRVKLNSDVRILCAVLIILQIVSIVVKFS